MHSKYSPLSFPSSSILLSFASICCWATSLLLIRLSSENRPFPLPICHPLSSFPSFISLNISCSENLVILLSKYFPTPLFVSGIELRLSLLSEGDTGTILIEGVGFFVKAGLANSSSSLLLALQLAAPVPPKCSFKSALLLALKNSLFFRELASCFKLCLDLSSHET